MSTAQKVQWPTVFSGLRGITWANVPREISAGITLAALIIPLNIGYAQVAGLPPVFGLYAGIIPLAIFAVFTSSRHVVGSPDAPISAILGAVLIGFAPIGDPLRAQLRTGSLISGQLYVAIDYFPNAPRATIDRTKEPPRFPVVPGKMENIENQLKGLLAKLDKVPVEEIGNDLKKTIETLDRTLARVEGETLPEAKKTLEDLRRAITAAERVLSSTDNTLLGPDAPAQQELRDALKEIARAAQGIRVLADYLERNPETLLRGKNKENP